MCRRLWYNVWILILIGKPFISASQNSFLATQSQNQNLADSLIMVLEGLDEVDTSRLRLLTIIANNQNSPAEKLEYAELLMQEAREQKSLRYLHHAYLNQGQAYRLMGDFDVAIYALFKALDYAERAGYDRGVAGSNTALADAYSLVGNHTNSVLYYKKALGQLSGPDSSMRALILLNLGDEYYMSEVFDSALVCFEESRKIYESMETDRSGLAYNLGNIGLVHAELGELEKAEYNVRQAIQALENLGDHYGSSIFLSYMAEIYQRKGLLKPAKSFADSSMAIARKYNLKTEIRDNSLRLADIYAMSADYETAYRFHQQYVALKDSIANDDIYTRIENLEGAFELAKKQGEVDLLTAEKRNQQIIIITGVIVTLAIAILALVVFSYYRSKARINKILEEQKRSLESLNQTKDKYFSIISHDLRGPVLAFHGISRMIKMFAKTQQTDQLIELADDIDNSVHNLSTLLDGLLNWALQQQGQIPNNPEVVNVRQVVDDLLNTFSNMATSKKVKFLSYVKGEHNIWSDRNTTQTLLRNLVNNAIKFTKEGGEVLISTDESEEYVEIKVADTGIGMSNEQLHNLFRFQHQKSTYGTAGEKGLGLGLQLVYEFVEMNNGKIAVDSKKGSGTTFTIQLPKAKEHKTDTIRSAS